MVTGKYFNSRSLSVDILTKFIQLIPLAQDPVPCPTTVENPLVNPSPLQIERVVELLSLRLITVTGLLTCTYPNQK